MQNKQTTKGNVEKLRESPLFQLSLGSKELFHSNFLAWLFEAYPEESGRVLSRFLKTNEGCEVVAPVLREHKNRDLNIKFKNGQELVIENKVKSLPYIEQLEMYSDGAKENQNFLLLSLVLPPFSEGKNVINVKAKNVEAGFVEWHTLTYTDLPAVIEQIRAGIKHEGIKEEYHRQILSDYMSFISALGGIFNLNTFADSNLFASYFSGQEFKELHDLRMGDIYQKLRYEWLASSIYTVLASRYPGLVVLSDANDKERQVGHIYVSHSLYDAKGMVTVSYMLAQGLYLSVQVQAQSYRLMVVGSAGYGAASRGVAERLKEKRLFFDLTRFAPAKEYPAGTTKVFNKFGVDFYRSIQLDPAFTVKEVMGFVIDDVERIETAKHDITAQVQEPK
jgi:PD-(D/E)XK nuclease superfamily